MADDDLSLDDGDLGGASSPKKGSALGGLLPSLLKWVAIAVGAIILIVTVVVITMQILNSNSPGTTSVPITAVYEAKPPVYAWYEDIPDIRTKTNDSIPASIIVKVAFGYDLEDNVASGEITARRVPIRDYLRQYFTAKKRVELTPQNEEALKLEIKNDINDILTQSSIKDVRFLTFEVIEQ